MSAIRFIDALLIDALAAAFFLARLRTLTTKTATVPPKRKPGRPVLGDAPMTAAERQRKRRAASKAAP